MTEEQAIRQAVERRLESLDDSFVGAVRAFEAAARAQSLHDVAGKKFSALSPSCSPLTDLPWRFCASFPHPQRASGHIECHTAMTAYQKKECLQLNWSSEC